MNAAHVSSDRVTQDMALVGGSTTPSNPRSCWRVRPRRWAMRGAWRPGSSPPPSTPTSIARWTTSGWRPPGSQRGCASMAGDDTSADRNRLGRRPRSDQLGRAIAPFTAPSMRSARSGCWRRCCTRRRRRPPC